VLSPVHQEIMPGGALHWHWPGAVPASAATARIEHLTDFPKRHFMVSLPSAPVK
jgi:hypothetical protein